MRSWPRIAALVAAGALVWGATPGAQASTLSWPDRRGDAGARYDLTKVTYTNSSSTVAVKAKVANLRRGRGMFGANLWPRNGNVPDVLYYATTRVRRDGTVTARLMLYSDVDAARVDCPVAGRWRPGRDVVRLQFDQACLGWHGGIRVSAFLGDPRRGDPSDFTRRHDVPLD